MPIDVKIFRWSDNDDMPLPAYATPGSAGMDLSAAVTEPLTLEPGMRAAVPTGFGIALPEGYEAQVRPRSGLALKYGIGMVNAPGTIDSDYRGEIKVLLINHGSQSVTFCRGDRIAQLIVAPVEYCRLLEVSELPESARGAGGFGSTGR